MRTFSAALCIAAISLAAASPAFAQKAVSAPIMGKSGTEIGKAMLTPSPHGVLIRIEMARGSLTPGWHGAHFHAVGDCSDTAKFEKSGGHVHKKDGGHGLLNAKGPEDADLPNIYAAADGSANAEIFSTLITLPKLQDADGSALVVHAGPDDHVTQPIGGAGDRVGCAVLPKP
jgi:Cu-Zn family superoxide dismutase